MSLSRYVSLREMKAPIIVYFEHLTSEYSTLKALVKEAEDLETVQRLNEKKKRDELSWNDLYTLELILAKYRPREQLRSKVIQLRNDYRSVAGQAEYDEYIASKPQNLLEPPDPKNPPDADEEELERLLREDMKDLLGRLFLLYEILPVREAELKRLTWRAARICLGAMVALFILVTVMFLYDTGINNWREWRIPSLTIFVVVIAGAMGGFVSALQRLQRPPSGGDTFYNLARLYYASYSVFIAPITGGIFAILLYLMFTAGILKGSFFPNIYTPSGDYESAGIPTSSPTPSPQPTQQAAAAQATPTATPTTTPGATPSQSRAVRQAGRVGNTETNVNTNTANASNTATGANTSNTGGATASPSPTSTAASAGASTNVNQAGSNANANADAAARSSPSPSPSPTPSPTPAPTPVPVAKRSLGVKDFLAQSGPAGGVDYAMLILWCFIAGFAERFVPDALDRLISQKDSSGGKP
ncbi:MAG TPA: hypothetical protein VJS44_07365 [Pyrinomonadaceae bacterium]|nr:hypothetical protein [Pyrinomonadaceae bacterium]